MSNFADLLQNSLDGAMTAFDHARVDLETVVRDVESAVQKVIGGSFARLELAVEDDSSDGTIFRLNFLSNSTDAAVAYFKLPNAGYPIAHGFPVPDSATSFQERGLLRDRQEIVTYFNQLLSSRDSALVLQIMFLQRQLKRAAG